MLRVIKFMVIHPMMGIQTSGYINPYENGLTTIPPNNMASSQSNFSPRHPDLFTWEFHPRVNGSHFGCDCSVNVCFLCSYQSQTHVRPWASYMVCHFLSYLRSVQNYPLSFRFSVSHLAVSSHAGEKLRR
jgi:hypothetical protein